MLRTVQLCGKAPSSRHQWGPLDGADRWIIGSAYRDHEYGPHTAVFDVHPLPFIFDRRLDAWAWYQTRTCPVWLVEKHRDVARSLAYPRDLIGQRFGARAVHAFSSSMDHMMALALLAGYEEIQLPGVRMDSVEEWHGQRECLAYWIGRAEGMGVTVVTEPEGVFCTPEVVYGFDEKTGAIRAPGAPAICYGVPGAAA